MGTDAGYLFSLSSFAGRLAKGKRIGVKEKKIFKGTKRPCRNVVHHEGKEIRENGTIKGQLYGRGFPDCTAANDDRDFADVCSLLSL